MVKWEKLRANGRQPTPVISIFDAPGNGGFRFAISRGSEVEYHRYLPSRGGYDFEFSKRLRGRIGRALMKVQGYDWNSSKPFMCEL